MQYKPIEKAPRDGTPILGAINKDWVEAMFWDSEVRQFVFLSDCDFSPENQPVMFADFERPPLD